MDINQIKKLVVQGESETLELKKTTSQLIPACKTICAYLNNVGGYVLFGISDNHKIIGQEISDKTKRDIGNTIIRIAPSAKIEIHYTEISNGKFIISLQAHTEHSLKPFTFDGKAYTRIQSNTVQMPREHYNHHATINSDKKWETRIIDEVTINDLDHDEIIKTVNEGIQNGRIPDGHQTKNIMEALKHLGLTEKDKITNAAIVLFARSPEKWFPQCKIKLARFDGIDHLDKFIDNKQVFGNAFKIIQSAMSFANNYLPIASFVPENSIERKDIPLFPLIALREIFANAACHRDYSYSGGSISFAIYNNRLEIWSYGLFPPGITSSQIKNLHKSIPPNPKIANVMYYRKLIESWGRGIDLVIRTCKQAGHPEPIFSQEGSGIKVTLYSKQQIGAGKYITNEDNYSGLNIRQREIMDFIKNNGETTLSGLMQSITHYPERTLQSDLYKLKQEGFLNMLGFGRGSKWILSKKTQKDEKKTQKDAERRRKDAEKDKEV